MLSWSDDRKSRHAEKANFWLSKVAKKRLDKVNPRRKLAKEEATKLVKFEAVAEKLTRGENVQKRQMMS